MRAPVLPVRRFVVSRIEREFLAVTHCPQPVGRNPQRNEVSSSSYRTPFAQCQIVLSGPALVAVPLNRYRPGGIPFEYGSRLIQYRLRRRSELGAVILEKNRFERRVAIQS